MPVSRRNFIRIAGASAVVAAAGATTFAFTRTPTAAQEPWHIAGSSETEPRRRALSYAILAPNPHNRQPWVIEMKGDDEMTLYCDTDRVLPATDPFSRQITIGLGCFLELLRMAAAEDGYRADITPFPEGHDDAALDARPIAHVRFVSDAGVEKDPLFAAVLDRRSNKETYDTSRSVSMETIAQLQTSNAASPGIRMDATVDEARIGELRDLAWRAHMIEMETEDTYMESVNLMRIGKAEIEANPDGIDLGGPFLETLKLLGMLNREALADMNSSAYQQGLDMYREIIGSAMGFVWIATPANTRVDQLTAGAAYLRLNLQATLTGVDMQPLSQSLQEYAEMSDLFEEVHGRLTVSPGETVQMFARLGYGPQVAPSPRWRADTKVLSA